MGHNFSQSSVLNRYIQIVSTGTVDRKQTPKANTFFLKQTTQINFQSQYVFTLPRNFYFMYHYLREWGYFTIKSSQLKLMLSQMIYYSPFNVDRREAL